MPNGKRVVPLRGNTRTSSTKFRYLAYAASDRSEEAQSSVNWASCNGGPSSAFKNDIFAGNIKGGGLFLSSEDLTVLGLITAPLALAWSGPTSAYFLFSRALPIVSDVAVFKGVFAATSAALLAAGIIHPSKPQFINHNKPCSESKGVNF